MNTIVKDDVLTFKDIEEAIFIGDRGRFCVSLIDVP